MLLRGTEHNICLENHSKAECIFGTGIDKEMQINPNIFGERY